ncbi:MAG: ComEC/Rec2 family competence protein [Candidatus Kaiserbacteria bacterium]|nr:ComEC/Rec2 family competence protein [Candidatus Kaiserbacteria bacterium]
MSVLITVVAGFASGVFLRSLFVFGWPVIIFVLILAAILIAAAFLKPRLAYSLGAVFFIFVAFGMVRATLIDSSLPDTFTRDLKHRVSYEGVIVSDPDVRDANQRVEIKISYGDETTMMLAVAPRSPIVAVGDTVNVSGTLAIPEAFADDNGRIFRYDKYLQRDGVRFMLNFAYLRVVREVPWYSVPAALARVKHLFLNGLQTTLPEPYASLAGGVVIGGKSGLGSELQDAFVRSGLVQIIVPSGYNVMVVAEWIMAALAFTKLPKRWGAIFSVLAVLIFVGIAGASATALRAMLMAFIALFARATGRSYAAGRALLVVVFFMILWNPLFLVFDPGFGLSVAATAGLIWLAPHIEILLTFLKNAFWKNALATTLAAQIAVLPLLLYDTGNLSLVSIPANLLTMPMVPLAMGLSALAGFAGMLFGSLAPLLSIVLAFPAYLANAYLIFIAKSSAAVPFAAFILPTFPFWLVLIAYAVLIYIVSSHKIQVQKSIAVSL